jgi:enoyl-CoA hydratase
MMATGRQVSADEALRIGLVDEVVDPDALMERALFLADTVASGASLAARAISEVVDAGMRTDLSTALSLEVDAFEKIFRTKDSQIGVASFLENGPGKARFTGK